MEMTMEEKLSDLVELINEENVFKVSLDWAFDSSLDDGVSDTYGVLTGRWAGQQHAFEIISDSKEQLYSYLDIIFVLSGFKGVI